MITQTQVNVLTGETVKDFIGITATEIISGIKLFHYVLLMLKLATGNKPTVL